MVLLLSVPGTEKPGKRRFVSIVVGFSGLLCPSLPILDSPSLAKRRRFGDRQLVGCRCRSSKKARVSLAELEGCKAQFSTLLIGAVLD
jgi:hypothetical protein